MSTLIETAVELGKSFILSENKKHSATRIIVEINRLVYPESKLPFDYPIKAEIIKLIYEYISTDSKDSTMFLGMMDYILKQLNNAEVKNEKIFIN